MLELKLHMDVNPAELPLQKNLSFLCYFTSFICKLKKRNLIEKKWRLPKMVKLRTILKHISLIYKLT